MTARARDALPLARARRRVGIGDVLPAEVAARMGLTPEEFAAALPELLARGFPPADPTTGRFDLQAVDRWRALRHRALYPELTALPAAEDPVPFETRRKAFFDARGGKSGEKTGAKAGGHGEHPLSR